MEGFARAIELLQDQPIKGVVPSSDEVKEVADLANSFTNAPENKDPITQRNIPTQAEVDALIAAVKARK
jgi:hypothetical protein